MEKGRTMTRLICLILLVWFTTACAVPDREYSFFDITDVRVEDVSRVEMRDGSTGELRTIIQREDIEALFDLLGTLEYNRHTVPPQTTGYAYYADFYSGDNKLLRITFAGERVQFDNTDYTIDRQIQVSLEEIFESTS
jgi:hypothetical protein